MEATPIQRAVLPPRNILVPTDFGVAAGLALEHGRSLAHAYGATLHIVHALKDPPAAIEAPAAEVLGMDADLDRHTRYRLDTLALAGPSGVPIKTEVVRSSNPALGILNYAAQAGIDLIVIGTHGHNAITDFILGSVAQKIIRSALCPVMTVRYLPASDGVRSPA